jgi:hypothetical protein
MALPLDTADRNSATWQKIKAHLQERLDNYREALERETTHDKSQVLRGKISEIKDLLNADRQQVQIRPVSSETRQSR